MKIYTAPEETPVVTNTKIFLAGSIEMGKAEVWQPKVTERFTNADVTFFNPRRADWDPTWSQDPSNEKLREQIQWELGHIYSADIVFFYIQAGTLSPITLLELGLVAGDGFSTSVVVCEPGFWREANVHETCAFFGVPVHVTLEDGITALRSKL